MADNLIINVKVNDEGTAKLERVNKELRNIDKSNSIASKAFDDLKNKVQELGVPLEGVTKYLGTFGTAATAVVGGVVAIGVALAGCTVKALNFGDELQDISDKTGLSVETISSMRTVLAKNGISIDQYSAALSKLSVNIGNNREDFKKLGIDLNDPAKAFDQLKYKIADIENPIERARLAQKAFGKSYTELMPLLAEDNNVYSKLKEGTTVYSASFAEMAARIKDKISILGATIGDFAISIGSKFLPVMETIIDLFQDAADFWLKTETLSEEQRKKEDPKRNAIIENYNRATPRENLDKNTSFKVLVGQEQRVEVKLDGKTLSEALAEYDKSKSTPKDTGLGLTSDKTPKPTSVNYLSDSELQYAKDMSRYSRDSQLESMKSLRTGISTAKAGEEAYNAQLAKDESEKYSKAIEEQNKLLERQKEIYGSIASTFESTLKSPYENFIKDVTRGNQSIGDSFRDLASGMLEAWGNMLAEMAAQLAAKATMFTILNVLTGGTAGGSGVLGSMLTDFKWFATGTEYSHGGLAVVGEQGPEIVSLPRGASVTPANTQSKGTTINNTFVVSQVENPRDIYKKQEIYTKKLVALGIV